MPNIYKRSLGRLSAEQKGDTPKEDGREQFQADYERLLRKLDESKRVKTEDQAKSDQKDIHPSPRHLSRIVVCD